MMFAYVGITKRFASLESSSEVLKIDLRSKRTVARATLPPPLYDLTRTDRPGGGGMQRGARGVVVDRDLVHVAGHDAIHVFDLDLNMIGRVSCDRFCDLHEFLVIGDHYVVTSTHADAVVWCDFQGTVLRVWIATMDERVVDCFPGVERLERHFTDWRGAYPRPNPTHLNALSECDGTMLVALHHQAVLWDIDAGCVFHDARSLGAGKTHNHVLMQGVVLLNDTSRGLVFRVKEHGTKIVDTSAYGLCAMRPKAISAPWAVHHGWLRGLAMLEPDRVLVGQCPASLLCVDFESERVVDVLQISEDWRWAVHGIAVIGGSA